MKNGFAKFVVMFILVKHLRNSAHSVKLLLPNLKNRLRANLFGLMSTESALLKA